ncbi:hypothetical protein GX408_02570, partial [bacterium]|nr:hypothetical protein [bacterium]
MIEYHWFFMIAALSLAVTNCRQAAETSASAQAASTPNARITATVYNSNFEHAHDTYNGLSSASDGKIYYVLCSELMDIAGQMYSFDPASGRIEHLADLSEICNEKEMRVVAQGKSHVNFCEYNGKLYFATHLGYYSIIDGMEKTGIPTAGYHPYRGGHFLSYDLKSKTFEDLALAPHQEGILTMAMDTRRGMIYGLTWPTGRLLRYDVTKKTLQDLGPATGKGENGVGPEFRVI